MGVPVGHAATSAGVAVTDSLTRPVAFCSGLPPQLAKTRQGAEHCTRSLPAPP
jgi:hypothetical protein